VLACDPLADWPSIGNGLAVDGTASSCRSDDLAAGPEPAGSNVARRCGDKAVA